MYQLCAFPNFSIMKTRAAKRLSEERDKFRSMIEERDSRKQNNKPTNKHWLFKNCLNCANVRSVLYNCAICQHIVSRDNVFLPFCQHTFCRSCLYEYLDKTSVKYPAFYEEQEKRETFCCPVCKQTYNQAYRSVHLKKNYLYYSICVALNIGNEPKDSVEC